MGADPVSQGTEVMIVTEYDCLVRKNGWNAQKVLEKQYLFRGSFYYLFIFLSHARDCTSFTLHDLTELLRKEGDSAPH